MASPAKYAEFNNPPVTEVVCGLQFAPLEALHAPHLGALWDKLKPDYPQAREMPPLATVLEAFGEPPKQHIQVSDVPPLARTWFTHAKDNGIVQVQRDRFHHNWKKVRPDDAYPRYSSVIQMFKDRLSTFEEFLEESSVGSIEPRQYEMTYVNHVPKGQGWDNLNEAGNVFPDFRRQEKADRFFGEPDAIQWRTAFLLPDQLGRLHVTIRNAARATDATPLLLLELTARGMPTDPSRDAMWEWFDTAHDTIVRGFCDLTDEDIRRDVWSQTR